MLKCRVVDVALDRVQVGEPAGKADGEQEAEQDLGTGDEGAQLLKQLAMLALQPFLDVFVLGSFPSRCSITSSVATLSSHARFVRHSTPSLDFPCYVGCVVGGVGSRRTQSDRPDDQRVLDPPWYEKARGLGKKHRAFRLVLTVAWRRGAEHLTA